MLSDIEIERIPLKGLIQYFGDRLDLTPLEARLIKEQENLETKCWTYAELEQEYEEAAGKAQDWEDKLEDSQKLVEDIRLETMGCTNGLIASKKLVTIQNMIHDRT